MKKIVKPHKARKSSASTDVPSFARGKDQILKNPASLQRRKKNELGEFDTDKDDHEYYDYIITQSILGNPTAKRMTGEDDKYIPAFGQGDRSNLVMSSYGNYATPSVMNVGGELMYVPNPWEVFPEWMVQNQSFRFNNPNDAIDFAENYKYSSPAFPEFFGVDDSVNYKHGKDSASSWVNAIYSNNPKEHFLGKPSHNYDVTIPEEEANRLGYYPDARGHRDDRVKKLAHPTHPKRGNWNGDEFALTDFGMQNPNYTMFGVVDGNQDPQAILTYKDGIVLPEFTVTPNGNYIMNDYDNIRLNFNKGKDSGIHIKKKNRGKFTAAAKRAGMSVQAYARKILSAPKGKYSPTLRRRAAFAKAASKFKH